MDMHPISYDQKLFTLPANQTDYNVKTQQTALFSNILEARGIVIFFDKAVSIRFNSTLMPLVALPLSRSPFQTPMNFLMIKNLYLTNTDAVNVEVWLW